MIDLDNAGMRRSLQKDVQRNQSEIARVKNRGNFILRQELKDRTPECTIKCSIIFNMIFFVIFLVFSFPIIISSKNSLEFSYDYTDW